MTKKQKNEGTPSIIKLSDKQNKKLEFFIHLPLSSANRLMEQLYSDDHFYKTATYAWVDEKDAKKLFLYGVCKEVIKICIGLINDREFLQETPVDKDLDRISKVIFGSIMDVQIYRIRKMVELLSILILFNKNTKKDEEYRIFLNAENMNLALAQQEDFRELYEDRIISNTQHSIDDFSGRITQDMQTLGISELWFLDMGQFKRQKPPIFKSKKKLFLESLLAATPEERIALGISYGRGYSRTSQSVHPLFGSHDYDKNNNTENMFGNFSYLSIICMSILHLAYKIGGIKDTGGITSIMGDKFEKSEASKAVASLSKEFRIGDIILTAWSDLAKIIDEHTSKYGYKAYRVKYISRPPLPEFSEDWLEAQMIMARLITKEMVREFYKKASESIEQEKEVSEAMKEVLKLPDEELMIYAEKTFLRLHEAKILIPMLFKSGFLKKSDNHNFLF